MAEHAEIAARLAAAIAQPLMLVDHATVPTELLADALAEITRLEAERDRKQAGWDACTAGLEELDRRLATAEAEVATLREALDPVNELLSALSELPSPTPRVFNATVALTHAIRPVNVAATPKATADDCNCALGSSHGCPVHDAANAPTATAREEGEG